MIEVRKSIGQLERRVTVKSTGAASGVDIIDTFGHPQKTWADLFTCWATREGSTGTANQEQQTANRVIYPGSYIYYMHYQDTVTEEMRLTDAGVDYDIKAVEPIDGKKFLALTVEKVIE